VQLATLALLSLASAVAAPVSAEASGAGYYVLQCHDYFRATPDVGDGGGPNGRYAMQDKCGGTDARLEITNFGSAVVNQGAQFTMTAPAGTTIREIHVDANLRRGSGHHAEVGYFNGSSVVPLVIGPDTNPSWQHYDFGGLDATQLVLRLYCTNGNCPTDDQAHLYARNIGLLLADNGDPAIDGLGGSLLAGGWRRGVETLSASALDTGAGVSALNAQVNGTAAAGAGSCNTGGLGFPFSGPIVPCNGSAAISTSVNTAAAPFHDGANTVSFSASDYPGNGSGAVQRTVTVDNSPPALAFTNSQDPADPELIRAQVADQYSGVASARLYMRAVGVTDWGSLDTKVVDGYAQARVDSLALPAGEYEFLATASDVAGNGAQTTARANGDPMVLTFPLRAPVDLRAHLNRGGSTSQVVRYGTDAKAKGLLVDAAGDPLANQQVTIVENFGAGALLRERASQATTDEKGKWRSTIPGGPSRDVRVTYGGTSAYAPDATGVGTFLVRSRASLITSRQSVPEGKAIVFSGRVRHFGARIPAGGKLVELQVRVKTGRWQTVGESFRTKKSGAYRRSYRFGKQYTEDALFRFRLKVKRESKWPYKRTNTDQRKVIVRAR
jgi:hypothetical protein